MEVTDKLVENMMKISKVGGFHLSVPGDPSVGIPDGNWTISGDFYFDNQKELDEFKDKLKLTWEDYCGENCRVLTFEEVDKIYKNVG